MIPKAPVNQKPGPNPKRETIMAARYVVGGEWTVYKAAKHFGVSPTAVRRRVQRIRLGLEPI